MKCINPDDSDCICPACIVELMKLLPEIERKLKND